MAVVLHDIAHMLLLVRVFIMKETHIMHLLNSIVEDDAIVYCSRFSFERGI